MHIDHLSHRSFSSSLLVSLSVLSWSSHERSKSTDGGEDADITTRSTPSSPHSGRSVASSQPTFFTFESELSSSTTLDDEAEVIAVRRRRLEVQENQRLALRLSRNPMLEFSRHRGVEMRRCAGCVGATSTRLPLPRGGRRWRVAAAGSSSDNESIYPTPPGAAADITDRVSVPAPLR